MASGAAGSSFTISMSFRAEMVMDPGLRHLGRHRHPRGDLEIGRRQPHRVRSRFDQDIGQDGQGLPGLHDVVHELESSDECVAIHMHFH